MNGAGPFWWQLRILLADGTVEEFNLLDGGPAEIERDWRNAMPDGRLCIRFHGCREPEEWIAARFTHWGESDMVLRPTYLSEPTIGGGGHVFVGWEAEVVDDPELAAVLR